MNWKQIIKRKSLYVPFVADIYLRTQWGRRGNIQMPAERSCNAVLKTKDEWRAAKGEVIELGLKPYGDEPKNWDALAAVKCVLENTKSDAHILDAGAEIYSVILPWLYRYGYTNLTGINLVFDKPLKMGPIRYEYGDITSTRFEDNSFDAITCMSVIEHGVDVDRYLREMYRILRPGGLLITSTDYYSEPIDTMGKEAYGVPVRIFSRGDMRLLFDKAAEIGFVQTGEMDLECVEKAVTWKRLGLDYTFIVFALKKR